PVSAMPTAVPGTATAEVFRKPEGAGFVPPFAGSAPPNRDDPVLAAVPVGALNEAAPGPEPVSPDQTGSSAAPPPDQAALNLPPQEGQVDGRVHYWLYDKIAELQRERQSRLQRVFNFLRGK